LSKKLTALVAATALGALALTPAAHADTVTMGSTLQGNFDGGVSGDPVLTVQLSYDPAISPNPVVSPVNGVITGWKVKSADDNSLYTLKVMRANGPVSLVNNTNSNFTALRSVVAPTPVPVGTGASTPGGAIFEYPASLPISQGDYIGLQIGGDADDMPQAFTNGLPLNLIANNFAGQPTDGASADLQADEQHDLLLQATVEFTPDGGGPAKKKKCKKKKKKKGKAAASAKKKCKKKKKK
jgi:hypothetical protein